MTNIITLKNEYLTVSIDSFGAEIKSIKDARGEERIHQPDMFWNGSAPILFPICGSLFNKSIKIDGKEYPMLQHGFAKRSEFSVMEFTEDIAVFSLVANDETRKVYPYEFELIITYKLLGKALDVSYEVINDSKENMYFSIGCHEGYNCMDGFESYEIEFETEESAVPYSDGDDDFGFEEGPIKSFTLSNDLFRDSRSLIFKNPTSNALVLRAKDNSEKIRVEYEGFDYLVIWSEPNLQFVCIEPWCGMGEFYEAPNDIKEKEGIKELMPNEQFEIHHIITID